MDKKLAVAGFIGGILGLIGVFLPWVSGGLMGSTISISGWDLARMAGTTGESFFQPYIVLIGGIGSILGGVGKLGMDSKGIGYLLPIGGIISLIGLFWMAIEFGDFSYVAYGFYACIVGAALALFGSLGLRG